MNVKTSIISTALMAAILLGAGLALGLRQNAFAGDGGEQKTNNCDITTFLAPNSDMVVSITAILQAHNQVTVNDTLVQNVTQEINQNTSITDPINSAVADADGQNVTDAVIEQLVNQTVSQDVATEIIGDAIVDVVQSGDEVTQESVNASAIAIVNDNATVADIANETVAGLNSTEIVNQVAVTIEENPDVLDNIVTQVVQDESANGNVTEQATKVIHMTTTGIPEGKFRLVDPTSNDTVVQDFNVSVKGGVPAGTYTVTIEPANEQTANAVIEATPDTSGNQTGTLQAENGTNSNAELPPQNATEDQGED